jgi:hypothetical protein
VQAEKPLGERGDCACRSYKRVEKVRTAKSKSSRISTYHVVVWFSWETLTLQSFSRMPRHWYKLHCTSSGFSPTQPSLPLRACDDDNLSEDPWHEPEGRTSQLVTTTAGLLRSLGTVAPVSGTIRRCGDHFEHSGSLQHGLYPRGSLPFMTVVNCDTALRLTRDPSMKRMTICDGIAIRPGSSLDKGATSESIKGDIVPLGQH